MPRDRIAGPLGEDDQNLLFAVGQLQDFAAALEFAPGDLERVGSENDLLQLRRLLRLNNILRRASSALPATVMR